jgi:hypothetical protein
LSPSLDQPHLIVAVDRVLRGPGGLAGWPPSVTRTLGGDRVVRRVVKHYGVSVTICPPRRGNRKVVVEKINRAAAQRWWRTLADELIAEAAQVSVDRFAHVGGATRRLRATANGRSSVAAVAKTAGRVLDIATIGGIVAAGYTSARYSLLRASSQLSSLFACQSRASPRCLPSQPGCADASLPVRTAFHRRRGSSSFRTQPAMNWSYADARSGGSTLTLHSRWVSPIGAKIPRSS